MTEEATFLVQGFQASTIGLLVYIVGAGLTRKVQFLRDFNIPEPVSGGLVAAMITMAIFVLFDLRVEFDLRFRDYLLLLFFAGIGLNARLSDLARGGGPLLALLGLTIVYIVLQNLIGLAGVNLFGLPREFSVLLGSAALIGGHGTVIAWSPEVQGLTGASGVEELGIAVATLGLVLAALIGGPIAKQLISRHDLSPANPEEEQALGLKFDDDNQQSITHLNLMRVMLSLHVVLLLGAVLEEALDAMGLPLPPFVPCLMMGIILGNILPRVFPHLPPVSRTPSLSVVSDFALGTFLAMSLMGLQLWTLAGYGKILMVVLAAQTLLAVVFSLYILFPVMGRGYRAAVLAAGFGGFAMGATPTAIANMNAVTKRYGPSPLAFVILPLVAAFFVDIVNSFAIRFFLTL